MANDSSPAEGQPVGDQLARVSAEGRKPWSTPRVLLSEIAKDTHVKFLNPESQTTSVHSS